MVDLMADLIGTGTTGGLVLTSGTTTNDKVWVSWSGSTGSTTPITIGASSTGGVTGNVWPGWVDETTGTTSIYTGSNAIYQRWVNFAAAHDIRRFHGNPEERVRATEQERRFHTEQQAERQRRYRIETERRAQAETRSQELLMSLLTPEQQRDWTGSGRFYVHVGDKRYRIRRGRHGNIDLVNERDEALENYCVPIADNRLPDGDCIAAQLLSLRWDQDYFFRKANRTTYRRPRADQRRAA